MVPRYRIGAGEGRAQVFLPDRPRRIHFQRRLSTSVSTQRTTTGVPCSSTRAAWGWKHRREEQSGALSQRPVSVVGEGEEFSYERR
jgi:hypothetical protein